MSQEITKKTLALFFTTGVSLDTWISVGNFDREKKIYEEHLKDGSLNEVHFFTYGISDSVLSQKLKKNERLHKNIHVHEMPKIFSFPGGSLLYSLFLPFVYRKELKKITIYKTNQMSGAWTALIAKLFYKKKVFLRTGYTWSLFAQRQDKNWLKLSCISLIESISYRFADYASVTSKSDKVYVENKYGAKNVSWIPNFIDTEKFNAKNKTRTKDRLVTVTRLSEQKNLENTIKALSGSGFGLDIYYGGGHLQDELESLTEELGADVEFKGAVANDQLPEILNEYTYFVLPSLYEGMPKTLLEAMACGCVCGGTPVPGIEEVLRHEENGIVAKGVNSEDIKTMYKMLHEARVDELSRGAEQTIRFDYSLVSIKELENLIFQNFVSDK